MESATDYELKQKNKQYYENILKNKKSNSKPTKKIESKKEQSFGSRKVVFSNFLLAPTGYEGLFYTLYFLLVPYSVGNLFLFFAVGGGDLTNYSLLDKSAFFIVWAIGYEIVATISLIWIIILFIRD